jgi:hypothetical protein
VISPGRRIPSFASKTQGWAWWLTPGILTISDVEIMRIAVQGEPGHKVSKVQFQPMACICLLMLHGETPIGGQSLRLAWAKRETLSQKLKQVGGLAQVVEHLPSNCQRPDHVHPLYHQKKKKGKQKPNQRKNNCCGSSDRISA